MNIEAARLFRMLKIEAYSEKTREILSNAISAFNRCNNQKEGLEVSSFSLEHSISLKAIGSFLYINQFLIQKADGDYENAMISLKESILHIQAARAISMLPKIDSSIMAPEIPSIGFHLGNKDIRQSVPWFLSIEPQLFVDCFEALRIRGHITDIENIIEVCRTIAYVSNESWLASARKADVKDADGYYWEFASDFWQHALGWLEAQLKPSELRELLHERLDRDAERRLSTYFFGDELWVRLPERTKSSLISADRDWFSGSGARIEAILNEIKIATEELLLQELWKPLEQWFVNEGYHHQGTQDFLTFKAELVTRGRVPTILDLERICRMPLMGVFLTGKGVLREDRVWFLQKLPTSLYHLRIARNRAEHESGNQWTRQELCKYFTEFIGIGRSGVLPELCRILLFQKR